MHHIPAPQVHAIEQLLHTLMGKSRHDCLHDACNGQRDRALVVQVHACLACGVNPLYWAAHDRDEGRSDRSRAKHALAWALDYHWIRSVRLLWTLPHDLSPATALVRAIEGIGNLGRPQQGPSGRRRASPYTQHRLPQVLAHSAHRVMVDLLARGAHPSQECPEVHRTPWQAMAAMLPGTRTPTQTHRGLHDVHWAHLVEVLVKASAIEDIGTALHHVPSAWHPNIEYAVLNQMPRSPLQASPRARI